MVLSKENGPGAHPARKRNIKNIFLTGKQPALWARSFTFYESINRFFFYKFYGF